MGFWDRKVRSSFDSMFDHDGDGYLNTSEQAMQFSYIEDCKRLDEKKDAADDDDLFSSSSDYKENDGYLYGIDTGHKKNDDLFGLESDWDEFDSDF